jgi:hypothetical protein
VRGRLVGIGLTVIAAAITFGALAYFTTLAEHYEDSTVGGLLQHCFTMRPNDAEGCGDLRGELNWHVAKHVVAAVAGSILLSATLLGGAWMFRGRTAPTKAVRRSNPAPDDYSMRRTALDVGGTYQVVREASSFPHGPDFEIGEEVVLREAGYSRYDSAYVYTFDAQGGVQKSFWLADGEPLELLTKTFVR